MLSKNEAVAIAETMLANEEGAEIGLRKEDETTYYFMPADAENMTGGSFLAIRKDDGKPEWLEIPPIENLRKWQKAKQF